MKTHYRNYNEKSLENLIFFSDMPPEKHRELSAKGGMASAESKRRKKAMQERAQVAVEQLAFSEGVLDDVFAFRRWQKRKNVTRKKAIKGVKKRNKS